MVANSKLEQRVLRAAEVALSDRHYVSAIEVLVRLGWLAPTWVDAWRQGRLEYLERAVDVGPEKLSSALRVFDGWAVERGLVPSETAYVARSRDRRPLRFSESGDPAIEKAYRTRWISPELSEAKRAQLAERQNRPADLVVIMPVKDWRMAAKIAALFPGCPTERAQEIARHAAARGSGRVGRSAAGRALDEGALELAVVASVRHRDTSYDSLLMAGTDRGEAREQVRDDVTRIVDAWRAG